MPSELRTRRIAERIRTELAELLTREVADPRLHMVTVTEVKVDRELAVANVWVCTPGEAAGRQGEVLRALRGAGGFLRRQVAGRMDLRTMPELKFHWDPSPDRDARLSELLDSLAPEGNTRGLAAGEGAPRAAGADPADE